MRRNAEHALGEKGSLRGQGSEAESGTQTDHRNELDSSNNLNEVRYGFVSRISR